MKDSQPDMFQPGTSFKFVEPNVLAVGWRCVTLATNSSDNKCDQVLMLALLTNMFARTFDS